MIRFRILPPSPRRRPAWKPWRQGGTKFLWESFFVIQYGTKHCEIVPSSDVISIEPDLCLLWEGGSSGEVVFVDQLNKSLRRRGFFYPQHSVLTENLLFESHLSCSVDHGICDDPSLSKGST